MFVLIPAIEKELASLGLTEITVEALKNKIASLVGDSFEVTENTGVFTIELRNAVLSGDSEIGVMAYCLLRLLKGGDLIVPIHF